MPHCELIHRLNNTSPRF